MEKHLMIYRKKQKCDVWKNTDLHKTRKSWLAAAVIVIIILLQSSKTKNPHRLTSHDRNTQGFMTEAL